MGYQPQTRVNRSYQRREKTRAKPKEHKHRLGSEPYEGKHILTAEEAADKALIKLRNLGDQKFGLSPFSEHFIRWLVNLRDALSEFESSPAIRVDSQFVAERSKILLSVEFSIEEMRRREASCEEAARSLSDARAFLRQVEEEHARKVREVEEQRDGELKRLSSSISVLREELDRLARKKLGIFGAISKKAKAQREIEVGQRLDAAQEELASAERGFNSELERLCSEYEERKRSAVEMMEERRKEVDSYEVDGSFETRRVVCEALISAVNALQRRMREKSN